MFSLPEYGTISSLARHGTHQPPKSAWRQKVLDRKADFRRANADVAAHRRNVDAGKVLVRLDADEVRRLLPLANRNGEPSGNFYRTMALPMRHGDSIQALAKPEDAEVWAAWMRRPGIDAFGPSLTAVDAAAGRKPGTGPAIALHIQDFIATLATLEGETAAAIPDAGPAANFLRLKAHFERGVINIHVTPARAARLADVFAAAGIARIHIVALDRIAGRAELRAF